MNTLKRFSMIAISASILLLSSCQSRSTGCPAFGKNTVKKEVKKSV